MQLQDKVVMKGLDVTAKAGATQTALIEEFQNIPVTDVLRVQLTPATKGADVSAQPILSGIEVLRTNATEIKGGVAGR